MLFSQYHEQSHDNSLAACFEGRGGFRFSCANCDSTYRVKFEQLGRSGKCRKCGNQIAVPNPRYQLQTGHKRYLAVNYSKFLALQESGKVDINDFAVCPDGEVATCGATFPTSTHTSNVKLKEIYVNDEVYARLIEKYPNDPGRLQKLAKNSTVIMAGTTLKSDKGTDLSVAANLTAGGDCENYELILSVHHAQNSEAPEVAKPEIIDISFSNDSSNLEIEIFESSKFMAYLSGSAVGRIRNNIEHRLSLIHI